MKTQLIRGSGPEDLEENIAEWLSEHPKIDNVNISVFNCNTGIEGKGHLKLAAIISYKPI